MTERWCVVIPVRLEAAKTRLSTLTGPQRTALMLSMALDVSAAAGACSAVESLRIVADPAARSALAAQLGDRVSFVDDPGTGLNAAIAAAADRVDGPTAALLGDLPSLTPRALQDALAAGWGSRSFVSDAEGVGTTLLMAPKGIALAPRFGERSRARHAQSGAREILDAYPGQFAPLRRDVDSEVSLWDARRLGVGPMTVTALTSAGRGPDHGPDNENGGR